MALTPVDISHKDFKKSFRGYNAEEVNEFLEKLAKEYEKLYQENYILQENKNELEKKLNHYFEIEESLRNALILAKDTAEMTKNNAKQEAELIIQEAQLKAEKIEAESNLQVDAILKKLEDLKQEERFFRIKFKALLESHLQLTAKEEEEDNESLDETKKVLVVSEEE